MTINFILNGEDVVVRTEAENRLINILRKTFKLPGTKGHCYNGRCGACSVFLNGELVKSCLIPAFKIQSSEIITIEGFSQTDEYQDIISGFSEAGVDNCGFCNSSKILTTELLLGLNNKPSKEDILDVFNGIKCRCTEPESLVRGVAAAGEFRRKRLYGRSS